MDSNVTRLPRRKVPRIGAKLRELGGVFAPSYTVLDVVNGLCGVCIALDDAVVNDHNAPNAELLVQAAKVLSGILRDQVEVG